MTTYRGGCHCGKVRYEVDADIEGVIECNCSICSKTATLLTFVPRSNFRLVSGFEVLRDYQFNHHIIHHHFCGECGIRSFALGTAPDGSAITAINVRCLDGVEPTQLTITHCDGRNS